MLTKKACRLYNAWMRELRAIPVLLLLTSLVSAAFPQDLAPASVSGIVMNASTNAPFPGVLIMMMGGGVATTDDTGRFVLKDVRPGTWTIQALKTGMAPPARDSAPRVLTVKAGEEIRDVRLWLTPLATLRGRITDPDGNPLKGVRVETLVVAYQAGNRILRTPENVASRSAGTMTGPDGEYELQLPPGKYNIAVNFTEPGQRQVLTSTGTVIIRDVFGGNVRTYYPGTLNSELAAAVTVAGGDTAYADFRAFLKGPELAKISGKIVGARARPERRVSSFQLVPRNTTGYAPPIYAPNYQYGLNTSPDTFEILGVARGAYDLIVVDEMTDGRGGRGMVPIEVEDNDIENIVVVLQHGHDIEGKVVVRGAGTAIPLEQIAIRGGPPVVMAAADGKFTLPDVGVGAQFLRVDGLPPDAYVADIRQGADSLFDSARTLAGPQYVVSGGSRFPSK